MGIDSPIERVGFYGALSKVGLNMVGMTYFLFALNNEIKCKTKLESRGNSIDWNKEWRAFTMILVPLGYNFIELVQIILYDCNVVVWPYQTIV